MKKFTIIITLVCAIFVAQFFGIGLILPTAKAADLTGTTTTDNPTIYDFITGLDITKISPDESDPLGTDVPQNGEFRMTYSFTIPQTSGLTDADYFFLDLPDYVHVPSNVTNINIVDSTYSLHVLDVSMLMDSHPSNTTGGDAIRVDFTSQLEANTDTFEFSGEFWFEASFDADEVDEGGPITINFDSGRSSSPYAINVEFIEDPPTLPTLDKNVSRSWNAIEHRHYYTWTLDFNPEDVDLGNNVSIVDELDIIDSYMEYIGASDPDTGVTQTRGSAAYTVDYDASGTNPVLTISFTDPVTERQTFTFQTALRADAYVNRLNNGSRSLNYSNTAIANTDLGPINSDTATSNYTMDVIDKNHLGTDTVSRRISYQIVANENDYIVDGAYVTDSIPAGLTMIDSTIGFEYMTSGIVYSATDTAFDATINYTNTGQDYQFNLGDITEEVRITFEVEIDNDQYYDQDNLTYRNDAYFHPPAANNWYTRGRRDVGVSTDVLQKSSTAIDITNGIITWQLIINPNTNATNPVQLADIVVTDPIPDNITTDPATTNNGLSYIADSIYVNGVNVLDANSNTQQISTEPTVTGARVGYDGLNNQIVVNFDDTAGNGNDIIAERYVVTYQTQIVDPHLYKRNVIKPSTLSDDTDTEVTNTARYTSSNAGSDSDSATREIIPEMLRKEFVSYDYDTHYFRWHIRVNPNDNELFNCVVTDYISEDMTYVLGSFEIFDGAGSPYSGGAFTPTEHDPVIVNPQDASENISYTLEYAFPATTSDSYDIYFETEYIDYDQMADNHLSLTSDYLEASNTAYLVHDELPINTYVVIGDSERFTSSVVEKASEYTSVDDPLTPDIAENRYIDWVLTINKNQIEIYGPSPVPDPDSVIDGPIIYDTLQEGLVIDLNSIKLYNATVNADNSITVDRTSGSTDEVSFDPTTQVTYSAPDLTFAFEDTISTCYVMTFRTYIEAGYRNTDFSNTASFHALAGSEDNTSSNERVLFATGGGYAAANIGHLLLTKIDADSVLPLAGATFELIDANGTVVDTKVTDASGEALFEFVFTDRQYYYRESSPPDYYSGDTTTVTGFTIPFDPTNRTYAPPAIQNTANPVIVELMKYTEDGTTGLAGATFAIYDQSAPAVEIAQATSDATGLVSFTNLTANRSYNIVEIIPPLGYLPYVGTLTVDVTVGGPFTTTPASITNVRDAAALSSVTFTKFAEDGATPLAGCVFGIYPSIAPTAQMGTATSQADGSVTFSNVSAGDYIIREISTVSGYELSTEELTVTVGAIPATYVTTPATLTNYLIGSVEVEVHSTFSLAGMRFRIGLYDESTRTLVRVLDYVDGTLTNFNRLPFGTYFATVMPNSHGLIGDSQDGTITISSTHGHVDIYITRNPQTGDRSLFAKYSLIASLLLFLGCVAYINVYNKRKVV